MLEAPLIWTVRNSHAQLNNCRGRGLHTHTHIHNYLTECTYIKKEQKSMCNISASSTTTGSVLKRHFLSPYNPNVPSHTSLVNGIQSVLKLKFSWSLVVPSRYTVSNKWEIWFSWPKLNRLQNRNRLFGCYFCYKDVLYRKRFWSFCREKMNRLLKLVNAKWMHPSVALTFDRHHT